MTVTVNGPANASTSGSGTVTHTSGDLTANQVVIGNGTDDLKTLGSLGTTSTWLRGNAAGAPTWEAIVANPTASVGLTAVNGTAATAMRSDGAPAIDQSIAPTWTAVHTFQQAVAATSTDGVVLATSATATSGNQKYSPRARFRGSYFSGSAKTTDWTVENLPDATGGNLVLARSDNGGAYSTAVTVYHQSPHNGNPGASIDVSGTAAAVVTRHGSNGAMIGMNIGGESGVFAATGSIFGSNGGNEDATPDVILLRAAAANWQFGRAAANPAVAQTLSVQDASGTDIAGGTWTFRGSRGTGAGVPGKIVFQVSTTLGTGTTLQTAATRFTVDETLVSAVVPLGYGTGAGSTVTQATSRTTGVTINAACGAITLVSAAGTPTWQTFTVTNNKVAATDTIIVSQKSGTDLNMISVTAVAAGSFNISFATTGGITTEQPVFNFAVIKAVTS